MCLSFGAVQLRQRNEEEKPKIMSALSDKFQEEYPRLQLQFEEWSPFEQFYSSLEFTRKLPLSYRYFLSQILDQTNNKQENNDMFNHTIHQANTPAILACLLSDPLDKIISTLLLYLPLVSTDSTNEKLLESYRDVLFYLDAKLLHPSNLPYSEQHLINLCQQIRFFIQKNPCLQKFLLDLPQLNNLASINKNHIDEKSSTSPPQKHHQPLQRYSTGRLFKQSSPLPAPLMNFSSDGSPNPAICPQLLRDASDSGVDLSEPSTNNCVNTFLISPNSQHAIIGRSHSANLTLTNGQESADNSHAFVVKTSSSPTPEQTVIGRSTMTPLSAVLSAPAQSIPSYYSDFRNPNSTYAHQQIKPTLTISDEDEEDAQNFLNSNSQMLPPSMDNFYQDNNNNNNRLRQFSSLRNRTPKNLNNNLTNNSNSVSQYLGIDGHTGLVKNTFIQPNSGMRDVPKWLKNLRLHKYAFFFSQMTYDQMMNLNIEQLKEGKITDGACTKILLNIKKLKERQSFLQQMLIDLDNGQIDLKTVLQQLNELMLTPIRARQSEQEQENDEDLPRLIMQVLEKVYQQLTSSNASSNLLSDLGNNLVGLFDRCYKHEAFANTQRDALLRWRGPLCNKLQTSGKIEFKSMQSASSLNRRVQLKPQTSMGNMNSTQISKPAVRNIKSTNYYSNYPTNSVPLTRQHNSECANENNAIRRPAKSPTLIFTTNNDVHDESSNHLSIVSSHSLQEQNKPFIVERSGNGSGNLRPSFNYLTSTPQRNSTHASVNINGGYLAANQHQLLTRKTSVGPYGEAIPEDKTKLCKTYSDPSKIQFYSSSSMNNNPMAHSFSPQQASYPLNNAAIYPPRQYLSRSPTNANHLYDSSLLHPSPIQKSYSDRETSVFYGNDNNPNQPSSSPPSEENHNQHGYSQRHNSTEFDTFCRQITDSALGDDGPDLSLDHPKSSPSNNSTDNEQ